MSPDELDLDAYLARVGQEGMLGSQGASSGAAGSSLELLTALHEAHVGAIPFENLDILLGRPIDLDLAALQAKLVAGRRGGYCFEQNTLYRAALERLGFRVTALAARVRAGAAAIRPRTHMLLRVDLPAGPYLADVGFGGDGLVHPLPLEAGPETWTGSTGFRLRREDAWWVLEGNGSGDWADLYAFTLEPHYPVDFEMANHFTSTYAKSPFVQNLTAQRSWPGRRAILRNRELTLRDGRTVRSVTVSDAEQLLEVLDREFGLWFPAGTRFAQPEF